MSDPIKPGHEPIGIRRNVIKTTPIRMTALWLTGIFILISATFIGMQIGIYLTGGLTDIAYWIAFFFDLFVCGIIGWFTIVIQENAQDIRIKIVKGE